MVEWLVSTAVEQLKTILGDEVAMSVGFTDEIEKLSSTFTSIQALLEDAESRRVKDRAVKIWLEKVKDVAYDVDDILDEYMTEALRSEAADEGDGSYFRKKQIHQKNKLKDTIGEGEEPEDHQRCCQLGAIQTSLPMDPSSIHGQGVIS